MMFDTRITTPDAKAASRGTALRAIGWHELTARINAARDLREVMAQDNTLMTASFGDAAAGYFATGDHCKPDVNSSALGAGKACDGISTIVHHDAETSEAREIND